jgi:hypothetical protein
LLSKIVVSTFVGVFVAAIDARMKQTMTNDNSGVSKSIIIGVLY